MKLFELKVELKAKLELAIIIPPTLSPTEAWGRVRPLVTRGGLERSYFCVTGQGSMPRPRPGLAALASPTLVTSSPELLVEDLAVLNAQHRPLPGAPGCYGP